MRKSKKRENERVSVPEIPELATIKPLHRRPAKGTRLPEENVRLHLQQHILTWFRHEAQRQKRKVDSFINEALRDYIIRQVGDPEFQAGGLNPTQRAEVHALVNKMLSQKGKSQRASAPSA
jgi:uncharacterized protein (DUF4415 family)